MRYLASASLLCVIIIFGLSQSKATPQHTSHYGITGVVEKFLLNANGEVNGFMLADGTQVNLSAAMASRILGVVSTTGVVNVEGFRVNSKIINADLITNSSTLITLTEAELVIAGVNDSAHADIGKIKLEAHGKVQSKLFTRRGELRGVILNDSSIVLFGPRLASNLGARTEVGSSLHATGFGTKNELGTVLEATEITNQ